MRRTQSTTTIVLAAALVGSAAVTGMSPSFASQGAARATVTQRLVPETPAPTPGFNGSVRAIAQRGSVVFVGGDFTLATDAAGTHVRRHAAAFDASTGRLLPWNPRANARVSALQVRGGAVFLGGSFTRVKGKARSHVALVRSDRRGRLLPFKHRFNGDVTALSLLGKRLYVGGTFTAVDRKSRGALAAFKTRPPYRLTNWQPIARKGGVHVLHATSDGVYVAGHFHHINKVLSSRRLALVTLRRGGVVQSFNPPIEKPVFSLAVDSGWVYAAVGGSGGGYATAFARSSGAQAWLSRFDGDVAAVALHGGTLYAGGHFHAMCEDDVADPANGDCLGAFQRRQRMAALTTGGALLSWNPGADSDRGVRVIASLGTYGVAFGGDFTLVARQVRPGVAIFR